MTITNPCYQPLRVCRVRAVRLDANDQFAPSPENAVVLDAVGVARFRPEVLQGEEITQRNGCGDLVIDFRDDDRPRGRGSLELTLFTVDFEGLEVVAGGTVLTDGSGNAVGYEPPGAEDGVPGAVAIELWGWAFDLDQPKLNDAGTRVYERRAHPKVRFTVGDVEQQNGATQINLNGRSHTNDQFGTGPEGDWPAAVSHPDAVMLDEGGLPTASCGYVDLAIAS